MDPTQPCQLPSTVDIFSRPPRGWAGTLAPQSLLAPTGGPGSIAVGLADRTALWVTGTDTISAATPPTPRSPQATALHAVGLATGRPRFGFSVHGATGTPTLASIALTLPAGLRFTTSRGALIRGVHATGTHTLGLQRGALIITLPTQRRDIAITVAAPALLETPPLQRAAQRAQAHRRSLPLRVDAVVTDAAGDRTPITLIR